MLEPVAAVVVVAAAAGVVAVVVVVVVVVVADATKLHSRGDLCFGMRKFLGRVKGAPRLAAGGPSLKA